jgi:predicted RNA-binding protein
LVRSIGVCEFKVLLNGETVFKDVVYAKTKGSVVSVKDILGQTKEFKNCRISEVDVNSTQLVLSSP